MKKILVSILCLSSNFALCNNLEIFAYQIYNNIDSLGLQENYEEKLISDTKRCVNHLVNNYLNIYPYDSKYKVVIFPYNNFKIKYVEIIIDDPETGAVTIGETLTSLVLYYFENNYQRVTFDKKCLSKNFTAKEVVNAWKQNNVYMSKLNQIIEGEIKNTLIKKINECIMMERVKDDLNQLLLNLNVSLYGENKVNLSYECMTCWRGICDYNRTIDNDDKSIELVSCELVDKILSYYSDNFNICISSNPLRKIVCKDIIDAWKSEKIYDKKVKKLIEEIILKLKEKTKI